MGHAVAVAEAFRRLHAGIVVPDYEALLQQTYTAVIAPGQTVIDIGAHRGRHTLNFARLVGPAGRVLAVEPIPALIPGLTAIAESMPWVTVHNMALSRQSGLLPFKLVPEALEQSGLKERHYDQSNLTVETINVQAATVDEAFADLDAVHFIKIDVEGGEIDCLAGATATLARCRPLVSVEYGQPGYAPYGNEARTLFDVATANGYVLSDFFANMIETIEEWLAVCDRSYWDYFMIPQETVPRWRATLGAR